MADPASTTHRMGATLIPVGLSQTFQFMISHSLNGGFLKITSGAGTLCIVDGPSFIFSQGYPVGASEIVQWNGPATFFLAAATATMTVAVVTSYSSSAGGSALVL